MKIIKNHVFPTGKIVQTHNNKNVFENVAGCVRGRKKVSTNTSTFITIFILKIDDKSIQKICLKKGMTTTQKIMKTGPEKGVRIHDKCIKKGLRKHRKQKKYEMQKQNEGASSLRRLQFKRLSAKHYKKTTLKKTNFRKFTFRKRKHTPHSNTPWAPSGPVRIYLIIASPGLPGESASRRRYQSPTSSQTPDSLGSPGAWAGSPGVLGGVFYCQGGVTGARSPPSAGIYF